MPDISGAQVRTSTCHAMQADRLAELDHQIRKLETFIERRRLLLAELRAKGQPTTEAESKTVEYFVRAVEVLRRQRDALARHKGK
jgi:hypothetical protein